MDPPAVVTPAPPPAAAGSLAGSRAHVSGGAALLAHLVAAAALVSLAGASTGGSRDGPLLLALSLPSVAFGLLLWRRRPRNPCGPALVVLAAGPAWALAIEGWLDTAGTSRPWPFAQGLAAAHDGVWVLVFSGFLALCLVFPDGPLPGRLWRVALPVLFVADALAFIGLVALDPASYQAGGGEAAGSPPLVLPEALRVALTGVSLAALLAVLVAAVLGQVLRYRAGSPELRRQLHLVGGALVTVPMVLALGWLLTLVDVPVDVVGSAVVVDMLVLVPAAVAVAVLRRDLFRIDRLLTSSMSWLMTTTVAAAIFAAVVVAAADVGGKSERLSVTVASFVIALVLLPVQRLLHDAVARVVDRDRAVVLATVRDFVRRVRDGDASPEQVEQVLRECLDDPSLTVLVALPGRSRHVGLDGVSRTVDGMRIPITSGAAEVGLVLLGSGSARRLRLAREAVVEARLPLEVSRLRLELRLALDDARASRARLVEVAASERRRLERDLHDGAQQQILAVGMRLRSIQRAEPAGSALGREIDEAVAVLEGTVAELRRLAHGVRPSRLDDGLTTALPASSRPATSPSRLGSRRWRSVRRWRRRRTSSPPSRWRTRSSTLERGASGSRWLGAGTSSCSRSQTMAAAGPAWASACGGCTIA